MKLRFGRLQLLDQVQTYPDPWGEGWKLHIRSSDSEHHRAFRRRQQEEDPVAREAFRRAALDQVNAAKGDGEEPAFPLVEAFAAVTREKLETGEISIMDYLSAAAAREQKLARAVDLLVGWEDIPGEEEGQVSYSEKAARELLTYAAVIPEGAYGSGRTVGDVLVEYIIAKGDEQAKFAADIRALAAKNSESPAAGAPSGGVN
jgi:hypothetical protein